MSIITRIVRVSQPSGFRKSKTISKYLLSDIVDRRAGETDSVPSAGRVVGPTLELGGTVAVAGNHQRASPMEQTVDGSSAAHGLRVRQAARRAYVLDDAGRRTERLVLAPDDLRRDQMTARRGPGDEDAFQVGSERRRLMRIPGDGGFDTGRR